MSELLNTTCSARNGIHETQENHKQLEREALLRKGLKGMSVAHIGVAEQIAIVTRAEGAPTLPYDAVIRLRYERSADVPSALRSKLIKSEAPVLRGVAVREPGPFDGVGIRHRVNRDYKC